MLTRYVRFYGIINDFVVSLFFMTLSKINNMDSASYYRIQHHSQLSSTVVEVMFSKAFSC